MVMPSLTPTSAEPDEVRSADGSAALPYPTAAWDGAGAARGGHGIGAQ